MAVSADERLHRSALLQAVFVDCRNCHIIPAKTNVHYNLRSRPHDRQLMAKSVHINDSLFVVRMLYKDCY